VIVSKYLKAVVKTDLEYGTTRKLNLWRVRLERESAGDGLVIGSSEQVHVVDALAITGDEGRGSLRKAVGSWQTSFDPLISEWGNPARMGHPRLNP
jgi:hypothetical protein